MPRILLLALFSLLLSAVVVRAQQDDILLPDEAIQTTIPAGETQRFQFTAQDEQMLTFYAEAIDEAFDPILRIYDTNETLLLENDDYSYPDSRDALIETFSAPYAGTFIVEVSGYADSEGAVELLMLPGYGQALYRNGFDELGEWETAPLEAETAPELEVRNSLLILEQEGISQEAMALGFPVQAQRYYVETNIESITGSQGWQAGLTLHYEDPQNYLAVLVNERGAWQMTLVEDGAGRVLRDWNTHPAITPGERSFTLGVLVNAGSLEAFYNGQYIGNATETLSGSGSLGVMLRTAEAFGSSVTARYESLLVTTPRDASSGEGIPPRIIHAESAFTARSLERSTLIPAGGSSALSIEESFVQLGTVGVSRFPLASGQSFDEFLFGATINWSTRPTPLNGCGLVIQDQGNSDTYLLTYLDSQGGVGMAQRNGEEYSANLFWDSRDLGSPPYRTLAIVREEGVLLYVNGVLAGQMETSAVEGGIGIAAINFEPTTTECQFDDIWLWQLP